jgi:hypothetical protein
VPALLAALALAAARPPAAYGEPGHVRLAVSSWCWGIACGAPIAAAGKPVVVTRGSTISIGFAVAPTSVRVAVSGAPVKLTKRGSEIFWTARRMGGMTINARFPKGFVSYVGRVVVR